METLSNNRFEIHEQLGEGSFSKIFHTTNKHTNLTYAIKVEKQDKNKKILQFEYKVLKELQTLNCVPRVYEFIESPPLNFIVMEKLGKNLAVYKKSKGLTHTDLQTYDLLIQMLNCIESVHNKGYLHRDIKPSNFVIDENEKKVYIVDFGLAKLHLNKYGSPFQKRAISDFRGTLAFASIHAHEHFDLGRRDDLWSFFFVILDFFNEHIAWRHCGDNKELIEKKKKECLENPEKLLFTTTSNKREIIEIFYYLKGLKYETRPNYNFIRSKLQELLNQEINKFKESTRGSFNSIENANNSNFLDFLVKDTRLSTSRINKAVFVDKQNNLLKKKKQRNIFKVIKQENPNPAKLKINKQSPLEIAKTHNFEIMNVNCKFNDNDNNITLYNQYINLIGMIEMEKLQHIQILVDQLAAFKYSNNGISDMYEPVQNLNQC